ncbi:MAG: diguanylate phosphodiesterase [Rhodospirillaceae bacterium]|nr:MAG: diguanylate phosphodiesterase [Rhodospirillaceae bacterium]
MTRDLDIAIVMKVILTIDGLTWLDARKRRHLPPIAVNIFGTSIANYNFTCKLYHPLSTYMHIKDILMLEITESSRIERLTDVNKSLQMFRNKGFVVCIDDFGAGAAGIDYLHMFDELAVRCAIFPLKGSEILTAMAHLCRDMRITTIAEIVEDQTIADKAIECGVDFG